ncbi:MAG: family NAD(P)-dependent oxidoreductase [Labilithrix sp.]|nr:family NAD(P)-dependent oxidoreductase [Labilithrix sp.]
MVRAMDAGLKGKNVIVTGSTAGIGFAAARLFAAEGAKVVVNGRDQGRTDQAVAALRKDVPAAEVRGFAADVSTAAGCAALIAAVPDVDVLVNNAGIFEPKPFEEIPDEDWQRFWETNVMSGIRLSRHYVKGMLARDWGRIVFVSSESAVQIPVEMIHYGTTKTAQLAVSRGLAERVRGTGVTVNCVLPGPTKSQGVGDFVRSLAQQQGTSEAQVEKDFFLHARPSSLIQRFATPDEIANLIVYTSSALASATTGAALRVDGGVARNVV